MPKPRPAAPPPSPRPAPAVAGARLSDLAAVALYDEFGRLEISPHYLHKCTSTQKRLAEMLGDKLLADITPADYVHFHDWLAAGYSKPVSINTERRRLRALFNRLYTRGYTIFDPCPLTTFVKVGKLPPKALPDEHFLRLMQRCCLRDQAMIMLALRSGIRRQTLSRLLVARSLIWQNEAGEFRFAAQIPQEKTSAPRVIYAGHDAAVLVKAWLTVRQFDSIYLFNHLDSADPLAEGALNAVWKAAVKRAGMKDVLSGAAWHRLRHSFARSQLSAGRDVRMVADWMGIDPATLLEVYAQVDAGQLAEAYFGEKVPPEIMVQLQSSYAPRGAR